MLLKSKLQLKSVNYILQTDGMSIADSLKATAEAAMNQTGYVYDEQSGLYYDYNTGYYYNAVSFCCVYLKYFHLGWFYKIIERMAEIQ